MQLRRLEGQDPLVVAERERRHRIGPYILVRTGRHAVLGQHPATFVVGQQIPVQRPDERIHADVVAGLLARQERGDVALVELGRAATPVWSNVALHRPAEFNRSHLPAFLADERARDWVCVYPFVRSYEWYLLPDDERRELLAEHGKMARGYPLSLIHI